MSEDIVKADTFSIGVHDKIESKLFASFCIAGDLYGVDALLVQEITRYQKMTIVPRAPDYILGLLNLRGQIVTGIDLRYRLTGESTQANENSMNLILKSEDSTCSVTVDEVGDVLEIELDRMEAPPDTLSSRMKPYVTRICKLDNILLCVLDVNKIIQPENSGEKEVNE